VADRKVRLGSWAGGGCGILREEVLAHQQVIADICITIAFA